MGKLSNKVAIVTGAARGIGAAIAKKFQDEGANVVLTDILEEELKKTGNSMSGDNLYLNHDVSKYSFGYFIDLVNLLLLYLL